MKEAAYVAACVVVPAVWGLVSVWLFRRFDRRRPPPPDRAGPPIDYSI